MTKATYVIIDMHKDTFHRGRPDRYPIVKAVGTVIEYAMERKCPIIFVKLGDTPQIVEELWDRVDGYRQKTLVTKYGFDGAPRVKDACTEHQFGTRHFRLCGVAADVCVRSTAAGLCKLFPTSRVDVLMDACDTPDNNWKRYKTGPARRVHRVRHHALADAYAAHHRGGNSPASSPDRS